MARRLPDGRKRRDISRLGRAGLVGVGDVTRWQDGVETRGRLAPGSEGRAIVAVPRHGGSPPTCSRARRACEPGHLGEPVAEGSLPLSGEALERILRLCPRRPDILHFVLEVETSRACCVCGSLSHLRSTLGICELGICQDAFSVQLLVLGLQGNVVGFQSGMFRLKGCVFGIQGGMIGL